MRETAYTFRFHVPKIRRRGPFYQIVVLKHQKPSNLAFFGEFLPALGLSCRIVLHTSVSDYRGPLPEVPLFFEVSGRKIGVAGSFPPWFSSKASQTLEYGPLLRIFVCLGMVLQNSAAHQCTCPWARKNHETKFCTKKIKIKHCFE